jgi:hypothetical protein
MRARFQFLLFRFCHILLSSFVSASCGFKGSPQTCAILLGILLDALGFGIGLAYLRLNLFDLRLIDSNLRLYQFVL